VLQELQRLFDENLVLHSDSDRGFGGRRRSHGVYQLCAWRRMQIYWPEIESVSLNICRRFHDDIN
jgi:hypothetical protein